MVHETRTSALQPYGRGWRFVELFLLYGLLPILPLTGAIPRPWFVWLYVLAVPAALWLRRTSGSSEPGLWSPTHAALERMSARRMLLRFAFSAGVVAVGTWWFLPDRFLDFPMREPTIWLAVMVFYPVLAVYPQELLFRSYFLRRYAALFPSAISLTVASSVFFGWAHVGYGHAASIILSTIGGLFFADTFRRSGSLRLACLEHALYGDLMFTIGLGHLFYAGWNTP
jgi:membrane protease YdiL (CAAX protease family)